MSDIQQSRPIRITSTGSAIKVYGAAVKVAAIALTAVQGDVYAQLTDGPGGEILWDICADDATSSPCHSFGNYPLLFKNGIYANITEDNAGLGLRSLVVSVILPSSSGT